MSNRDRINLFPSTANLVLMKQRLVSAITGLNLLKRKRDALEIHLKQLLLEFKQQRERLDMLIREAYLAMAKAKFLGADFKPVLVMNTRRADTYLHVRHIKVIGLNIRTLDLVMHQNNSMIFTGLSRGGQQVQLVREMYQEALEVLVNVVSLQYALTAISAALKQNNMRVNGLEYVLVPRYQNTVYFIRDELDELSREEFYRLKRSQANQRKKKSEFIKLYKKREKKIEVEQPEYDGFTDTDRKTIIEKNLAARPTGSIMGPRRTVCKIRDKTVVVETLEQKPVIFADPLEKLLPKKKTVCIQTPAFVTSSSSESSDIE